MVNKINASTHSICSTCVSNEEEPFLITLPNEILFRILKKLTSFRDIRNASLVDWTFCKILESNYLWGKYYGTWLFGAAQGSVPNGCREKVQHEVRSLLPALKACVPNNNLEFAEVAKVYQNTLEDRQTLLNELHPPEVSLTLQNIPLRTLPREVAFLDRISILELIQTKLIHVCAEIGSMRSLETLRIRQCSLESLPPEIGNLENLRFLDLTICKLRSLPVEIGNCTELEQLWLGYNNLESLPESLRRLSRVKAFHAEYNKLLSIPFSLKRWTRLEEFWVQGNKIEVFPKELKSLREKDAPYSDGPAFRSN